MTSFGFLDIEKVLLPRSCALQALDFMQQAGRRRVEGVALWAGRREGTTFRILRAIIPEQKSGTVESGLLYVVGGAELHRIALDLFDSGQQLVAQVHTHPGAAYHSDTDDAYPIVTVQGGLSLVVPNFARGGLKLADWAVYRFLPITGWTKLTKKEQLDLIEILDDVEPPKEPRRSFWYRLWH